jgi:hypothetical protein
MLITNCLRGLLSHFCVAPLQSSRTARLGPVVAHSKKKRVAGLNRGTISTNEDFDEPLPDEFWLGQE